MIQPTIVSIPKSTSPSASISSSSSKFECPAFQIEEEYDAYVDSVSPSRELVCPITQEVLQDPVVAEDGHTYERSALMKWFSMGRTRSPVTNSIMSGKKVFPNLAVHGMAQAHRDKLGMELLERAKVIRRRKGQCPDNGSRIAALLDAGASTTIRDDEGGNTALLMFLQAPNVLLARTLLQHDSSSVNMSNNEGKTCVDIVEEYVRSHERTFRFRRERVTQSGVLIQEWKSILEEIKREQALVKVKTDEKNAARAMANDEHRERQRTLAEEARTRTDDNPLNPNNLQGLGELEDGWGHFPSLVALQFQSNIPPPPASSAELEFKQRQKLEFILKSTGILTLLLLLWC